MKEDQEEHEKKTNDEKVEGEKHVKNKKRKTSNNEEDERTSDSLTLKGLMCNAMVSYCRQQLNTFQTNETQRTPRRRVFLVKRMVAQLVKNSSPFV
jgi:hypothetical protein